MLRFDTKNLAEKSIKDQTETLWTDFESMIEENLFECFEEPTDEERNNALMVMTLFASYLFKYVLSSTVGNVREVIAKMWIMIIGRALEARRIADYGQEKVDEEGRAEDARREKD